MKSVDFKYTPDQIELIEVSNIQVKDTAIRTTDVKNLEYIALLEDVTRRKVIDKAIDVVRVKDLDGGIEYYELMDGGHRLTAAKTVGLDLIPAFVWPEDTPLIVRLGVQLRNNVLRVKQNPAQAAKQIVRIVETAAANGENLSISDVAQITGTSEAKLRDILKFTEEHMKPELIAMVESGAVSAANARELAKAGPAMQSAANISAAQVLKTDDLVKKLKTEKQALQQGDTATPKPKEEKKFEAKYKPRDRAVIEQEIATGSLAAVKFADPAQQEAFVIGVQWAVSLDEDTITAAREEFERKAQQSEELKRERLLAKQRAKLAELEGTEQEVTE